MATTVFELAIPIRSDWNLSLLWQCVEYWSTLCATTLYYD